MKAKQAKKHPIPDVKGATKEALLRIASIVELADWNTLFGLPANRRCSDQEVKAFTEAKALAVAYVRKGAEL